ncbi:MAG: ABC transporter permease subunit [Eubacteriales bacterium]|nr:ABC transporter permease subunit [Eubacteriales bacterium]
MHIFGRLYRFECKKIWDRKLVKTAFVLCLLVAVVCSTARLFGRYVVDGAVMGSAYDEIRKDQAYARALDGRPIDQRLLEEMSRAYQKVRIVPGKHYTGTPEYQTYARPYSEIFNFALGNTALTGTDIIEGRAPTEQALYAQRQTLLEQNWRDARLTEGEIAFWTERESRIEKPVVFREYETYNQIFLGYQTVGFLVILFLSIALSGVFPEEHSRRTDQLLLSSPRGKGQLYWAKMLAGISCAVAAALVLCAVTVAITVMLYGGGGFHGAFQLDNRGSSDPITCGQAMLIAYGNLLVTAVLVAVAVMLLSELLRSSMAAMAISAGMLLASMLVNVPEYDRVLAQLWDWQPWAFLAPWNVFGRYTLPVPGGYLTAWQAVPILYVLVCAAAAWGGRWVYRRYQVSGR